MRNGVAAGLLASAYVLGGVSVTAHGQIAYDGASRFVAVTGFGFLTDNGFDRFSATLGDPELTFASQVSEMTTSTISAFGAAADADFAGMSSFMVDFTLASDMNFELSASIFGEGSKARLVRMAGSDEQVIASLPANNELIVSTFTSGILEAGNYRFELATQSGPVITGGTPWFYRGVLIVPAPTAAVLPLAGLLSLRRRR